MRRIALAAATLLALSEISFGQTTRTVPAGPFLEQIKTNFTTWDRDKDGKLSFDEIELACADPKVKGPTAAAAATMRNLAKLRGLTLAEYTAALTTLTAEDRDNVNNYEASFTAALKKLNGINRQIFPAGLPKGDQLAQGKLGDCFLLVGVGTMAQTQPERLKALIEPLPGDKFAVNFKDGKRIELPMPTDAEVIIGSSTRGDGVWGNAFEKAIGQRYLDRQLPEKRAVTPYAYIGKGGQPNVPVAMMTGKKLKREGCEMFQKGTLDAAGQAKRLDEIRDALENAFKDGRLVIGGTAPLSGPQAKVRGLYYNHSYGVLNYDRKTDVVTFWNPMSNAFTPKGTPGLENGYKTSYGRFDCPLKEAVMWFGSFSIEQNENVAEIGQK
ncbi:MAG: hypothetical protein QM754_16715 [Tepidisphaeraceae bacterium]